MPNSPAIHKKLDYDDIETLEKICWELNNAAMNCDLRETFMDVVRDNRRKVYQKHLGPYTFPFEGASDRNIPVAETVLESWLDDTVNALTSPAKKFTYDVDMEPEQADSRTMKRTGQEELSAEKKGMFDDMFEDEIKSNRFNYSNFCNEMFKIIYRDGIGACRVVKELKYGAKMVTKPLADWMLDEDFKKFYKPQILASISEEKQGIPYEEKEEELTEDEILNQLPAEMPFMLKMRTNIETVSVKPLRMEDICFPEDSLKDSYDFVTHWKQMSMDDIKRYARAEQYYYESVDELEDLAKDRVYKDIESKYHTGETEQYPDNVLIEKLSGRYNWKVGEMYIHYDVDKDGFDELCLVEFVLTQGFNAAGTAKILRVKEYHRTLPPIRFMTFKQTSPLLFSSRSLIDQVSAMTEIINKLFNDNMDNNTLNNSLILKYSGNYRPDDFIVAPGASWYVENMEDVQVERFPELKGSSLELERRANSYIQNATGSSFQAPTGEKSHAAAKTSSGLAQIMAQGSAKKERYMKLLVPDLNEIMTMYMQELTGQQQLKINVNYNIFNTSREYAVKTTEYLMGLLLQDPQAQQIPGLRREAYKRMFEIVGQEGFDEMWPEQMANPQIPQQTQGGQAQGGQPQPGGNQTPEQTGQRAVTQTRRRANV